MRSLGCVRARVPIRSEADTVPNYRGDDFFPPLERENRGESDTRRRLDGDKNAKATSDERHCKQGSLGGFESFMDRIGEGTASIHDRRSVDDGKSTLIEDSCTTPNPFLKIKWPP